MPRIALADTDAETAAATAKALNDQGRTALAVGADTSDETSVKNMVVAVMDKFQRIDILVNNAAIYPMARLAEMETALWDKVLGVNLRGPVPVHPLCRSADDSWRVRRADY